MSQISHSNTEKLTGAARGVADAVREKGREIRDSVEEMGAAAKDMAKSGLESARATASDYADRGLEKAKALEESLEIQIRTRPVTALLCAAGIGFLAAMLWKRTG